MSENSGISKYKIISKLQDRGFTVTYLAENIEDGMKCIIKSISLKHYDNEKLRIFTQEAQILNNLSHQLLPELIEYFTEEDNNKYNFYLVSKYIEGKSFKELVEEKKIFSENKVLEIALSLADTLIYLSSFSPAIVHMDIKPSNIIYDQNNKPNLIDFGAAKEKLLNDQMSGQGLSTIIGTQGYMPIEQFEGNIQQASDIYSLGLVLIYLLSGKEPLLFEKKKLKLNFKPHLNISDSFATVIEKMIEPDFKKRYQNPNNLKRDLELVQNNTFKIKPSDSTDQPSPKKEEQTFILDDDEKVIWSGEKKVKVQSIISKLLFSIAISLSLLRLIITDSYSALELTTTIIAAIPLIYLISFYNKEKINYLITDKRILLKESYSNKEHIIEQRHKDFIKNSEISTTKNLFNNSGSITINNGFDSFVIQDVENCDYVEQIIDKTFRENKDNSFEKNNLHVNSISEKEVIDILKNNKKHAEDNNAKRLPQ